MNKFLTIFLFFAAAVCCSAQEEFDQVREREVGLLLGNEKLFENFCLRERDVVIEKMRATAAQESSVVFDLFFDATTEIGDEVLTVEKQAVAEFAKQIAKPTEKVDEEPLDETDIQARITKAKLEIQSQPSVFGRFVVAAKSAVGPVLISAANSAVFTRLAKARAHMNAETLRKGIANVCQRAIEWETMLENHLEEAKPGLKEKQSAEVQKFIDSVSLPSLKCYTTKFVTRVSAFCNLIMTAAPSFMKMLGLNSDFTLTE